MGKHRRTNGKDRSFLRRPARRGDGGMASLQPLLDQAEQLMAAGDAEQAILVLEAALPAFRRSAKLHSALGRAHLEAGYLWVAAENYERAFELKRDPAIGLRLGALYAALGLRAHALGILRQVLKRAADPATLSEVRGAVKALEGEIARIEHKLGLPPGQVEPGLRHYEQGRRALESDDLVACIRANRCAIQSLGPYVPAYNNLAVALFFNGEPEEAITTSRQVLSRDRRNVHALSNLVRFLAWSGRPAEARVSWEQLRQITPRNPDERLKMAEAASMLDEDEQVYQLLIPLDKAEGLQETLIPEWQVELMLAVAELNTGQRGAETRLRELRDVFEWIDDWLAALHDGQPGPGYAQRFPYYHSSAIAPQNSLEELMRLAERRERMTPEELDRQRQHIAAHFPQLTLIAEKLIWEEGQPEGGIEILDLLGTPAAYAALRRFGLSQAGPDDLRLNALLHLQAAGQFPPDEPVQVWSRGEWRQVRLQSYLISDRPELPYSPQVNELLEQAETAYQEGDLTQAEDLFQRARELEPRAKEACNNLGTLYANQGRHAEARALFQAALEIDPDYVFPRGNLAIYRLQEGDPQGALDLMRPLADRSHFSPREAAFYYHSVARIQLEMGEPEVARKSLEVALEILPDYTPAQELLDELEGYLDEEIGWEAFLERQRRW